MDHESKTASSETRALRPVLAREFMTDDQIIRHITVLPKWCAIFDDPSSSAKLDLKARIKRATRGPSTAREFVELHYKGDTNAADLDLCLLLAQYTTNPGQVSRLWQRSMLWAAHGATDGDYSLATINRALSEAIDGRTNLVDTSSLIEVTWLWAQRFPRGKLVIMDGDPGLSKSMFALAVAVSVMTGKPLLDGSKPESTGGVVLLSAEDDLRDTINPRLVAAGAPIGEIPLIHVPSTKTDGSQFSLADPNDRLDLEMMIARVGAPLVIIDPLNAYLGEKIDSHNDKSIRQVLGPLSEIANRTGAVVLCLRHLAKSGGGKAIYRGLGSIGYTAAARAQYFMAEHPEEEGYFVFACAKFNLGPKPPSLKYKLAFADVPGISKPVPYVASGEPCDLSANDLASVTDEKGNKLGPKVDEAVEFLKLMLGPGPMVKAEIEKKADREKISPATLRRAQDALEIKPYQKDKKWWWELPAQLELPKGRVF